MPQYAIRYRGHSQKVVFLSVRLGPGVPTARPRRFPSVWVSCRFVRGKTSSLRTGRVKTQPWKITLAGARPRLESGWTPCPGRWDSISLSSANGSRSWEQAGLQIWPCEVQNLGGSPTLPTSSSEERSPDKREAPGSVPGWATNYGSKVLRRDTHEWHS